jgi:hypothetical protein
VAPVPTAAPAARLLKALSKIAAVRYSAMRRSGCGLLPATRTRSSMSRLLRCPLPCSRWVVNCLADNTPTRRQNLGKWARRRTTVAAVGQKRKLAPRKLPRNVLVGSSTAPPPSPFTYLCGRRSGRHTATHIRHARHRRQSTARPDMAGIGELFLPSLRELDQEI